MCRYYIRLCIQSFGIDSCTISKRFAQGIEMIKPSTGIAQLDQRSRDIFKRLVETYLETGVPVGSRTISQYLPLNLSPASVRSVMSDLEELGLIFSPHRSAGRMPTESGLRMFVDGFLEIGSLSTDDRSNIAAQLGAAGKGESVEDMLAHASNILSGLSHCAGVVVAPKINVTLKHMEFVALEPTKALVVLVGEDGSVENRIIDLPPGMPASTLVEASNYLNAQILGKTIDGARKTVFENMEHRRNELDVLTTKVVEAGLAVWAGENDEEKNTHRARAFQLA